MLVGPGDRGIVVASVQILVIVCRSQACGEPAEPLNHPDLSPFAVLHLVNYQHVSTVVEIRRYPVKSAVSDRSGPLLRGAFCSPLCYPVG